jgi:peptide/nickel transport system permease protein
VDAAPIAVTPQAGEAHLPGQRTLLRRVVSRPAGAVGLALTLLVCLIAWLADDLATSNPLLLGNPSLLTPSRTHLFGTDNLGRDLFSAVVYGLRTSMTVVLWVTAISAVIGVVIGAVAGFVGGLVERLLMNLTALFQTVPRFFLALLVLELFGRTQRNLILLLGVTSWTVIARVARAEALSIRSREFIGAARSYGAPGIRILVRHILPNLAPSAVVVVSLNASRVILLEAGLAFLGLSDQNKISLGFLINNAQLFLEQAWWMSVFPGLAIVAAVLGINLLADTLNDVLNPLGLEERAAA